MLRTRLISFKNELHLHTIFFDKMCEHLLSTKRIFHVIDWLDEFLLNISFIHILTRANKFCKRIVGSRGNFKHRPHWRSEKLRMAGFWKRFVAREIADCHEPGSIWLYSKWVIVTGHKGPNEAVLKVEGNSMD